MKFKKKKGQNIVWITIADDLFVGTSLPPFFPSTTDDIIGFSF